MAFICADCIAPACQDQFMYLLISRGPCENCGRVRDCVDTRAPVKSSPPPADAGFDQFRPKDPHRPR